MNHALRLLAVLALLLTFSCDNSEKGSVKPQASSTTQPANVTPVSTAAGRFVYPPTTQPGRILPGDLLTVEVFELLGTFSSSIVPVQVSGEGTVMLPFSKPMGVAGKMTWAAEDQIRKFYNEANIIQNANVQVRRIRINGTGGPPPAPIGNFDLVRIMVGELNGPGTMTVRIARVDGDGMVSLPYIGRQKLSGLSDQQSATLIQKVYREQNIIQQGIVSVLRLEAASADAGKVDLPDGPVDPVPESLRWLYEVPEIHVPVGRSK